MANENLSSSRRPFAAVQTRTPGITQRTTGRPSEASRTKVLWVAKVAFEELARAFVEHGIPSQVAERLLRAAYVRETAKNVRRGWGQGPNVSQISVKTGLDRHLVKAILKDESEALRVPDGRRDPISKVSEGWLSDREYSTRKGPRDLPIGDRDRRERSMCSLIERYAPGISPRLVIDELLRVNLVRALPNGKLRWSIGNERARSLPVPESAPAHLRSGLRALFHQGDQRRAPRKTQTAVICMRDVPLVRKMLKERVDHAFSLLADELSSSHWRTVESGESGVRLGLIGFTFEEFVGKDHKNDIHTNTARSRRERS
jgi:hypothetical protein